MTQGQERRRRRKVAPLGMCLHSTIDYLGRARRLPAERISQPKCQYSEDADNPLRPRPGTRELTTAIRCLHMLPREVRECFHQKIIADRGQRRQDHVRLRVHQEDPQKRCNRRSMSIGKGLKMATRKRQWEEAVISSRQVPTTNERLTTTQSLTEWTTVILRHQRQTGK